MFFSAVHEARCELSKDVQRFTKELEAKSEELNKTQAELVRCCCVGA